MRVRVLRSSGLLAVPVVLALVAASPAGARSGAPSGLRSGAAAGHVAHSQVAHSQVAHSQVAHSQVAHSQVGRWTLAAVAPGSYRLTWHSPSRIPTTDAAVQV